LFHTYSNLVNDVWFCACIGDDKSLKVSNFSLKSLNDALKRVYERVARRNLKVEEEKPSEAEALLHALAAMYEGRDTDLNFKLSMEGLPAFSVETMETVRKIPRGSVSTYKNIARAMGQPLAMRAVGNVMARNPFVLVVPCHRVVKSDLSIGKYAMGAEVKRKLLEREGVKLSYDPEKKSYRVHESCLYKFI
jgi:methylated-DNA-[protein]-cysteine S-methyltransferase